MQNMEFATIDPADLNNVTGGYKVWNILGAAAEGAVEGGLSGFASGGWQGALGGAASGAITQGGGEYAREVAAHRQYKK